MPIITVPLCMNIEKTYNINIIKYKNTEYKDNTDWIPYWFYTSYDPEIDNVTFEIRGDFHETYPNPAHLSVRIIYPDKSDTGWLHISKDDLGYGYIQNMGMGNKKTKRRKSRMGRFPHKKTKRRKSRMGRFPHKKTKRRKSRMGRFPHKK